MSKVHSENWVGDWRSKARQWSDLGRIKMLLLLAIQKRRGYPEHMRFYLSLPVSCMSRHNYFYSNFCSIFIFSYNEPEKKAKLTIPKKKTPCCTFLKLIPISHKLVPHKRDCFAVNYSENRIFSEPFCCVGSSWIQINFSQCFKKQQSCWKSANLTHASTNLN